MRCKSLAFSAIIISVCDNSALAKSFSIACLETIDNFPTSTAALFVASNKSLLTFIINYFIYFCFSLIIQLFIYFSIINKSDDKFVKKKEKMIDYM